MRGFDSAVRIALIAIVALGCAGTARTPGAASPPQEQLRTGSAGVVASSDSTTDAPAPIPIPVTFTTHDGHPMFGKLTLPAAVGPHPVVVYVQTAEGMTIDMRRPLGRGRTFDYFDLYRRKLPELYVGFFSYEGRGVRMGDRPPRFEAIDSAIYNTSTLENKVRDLLAALDAVRAQPGVDPSRILVLGTSEGTLLAAEAAARAPDHVAGLILYSVMADNMREVFRYIVTDGGFLSYRGNFDTDQDGRISEAEFTADPRRYRERALQNAPFSYFDRNGDGHFTTDEMGLLTKIYVDAIDNEDFAVLDNWARLAAGVSTPDHWFRDHFNHASIWTFLSTLNMPVGLFHGIDDTATPVAGVRRLESLAQQAGKTNLDFHYFEGRGHSLGVIDYFVTGELPEAHRALLEYIGEQAKRGRAARPRRRGVRRPL